MTLPQPTDAFAWVQAAPGPALVCRPLLAVAAHLFTTRSWPLGAPLGGDEGDGRWRDVAEALACDLQHLVQVRQVHGAGVAVVSEPSSTQEDADILLSDNPALALAVRAADCIPLLLADARTGAVAAAHAGWRGLVARVPEAAVRALARAFGSRPRDLIAAVGPSIGSCCYEVGADVQGSFARAGFGDRERARWFSTTPAPTSRNLSMPGFGGAKPGHWFLDTWSAARDQLTDAGLAPERIFIAELCTASHPTTFCSYRRDGSPAGRLAGAIRRGPPRP
jgi:YfiH family protein